MINREIRSYEIDKCKGLVLQRFFNVDTLWLRLVLIKNEKVISFKYLSMEDHPERDSWEKVANLIKSKVLELRFLEKGSLSGLNLYPTGWSYWALGIPAPINKSGIHKALNTQAQQEITSEFPNV